MYDRKYGAFSLSGAKRWSWFDFYETFFCPKIGPLMTFSQCSSPLCKYYQQKCFSFMYASYGAMTGGALGIFAPLLALFATKNAYFTDTEGAPGVMGQMFGACCLATASVGIYCYMVPSEIGQINQFGDYPMPVPGITCFCMAIGSAMLFMASIGACCLHRALKEYDEDEDEVWAKYDRDDSDDSD
uniref:Uncharacterized protein n=1 Tax=Chromera velia CCMP2878 TaxID=1169474 RepID=A0A0G4HSZ3_9ALVE|eukprot:Cvel_8377.t1-p1 / transcript=Cvel_8377.t1 / gene=Cvel_8377 / organism=Chromera_velia_CCMP2878 / gene_product=hypothetical protein / transcript_product=hypothetical protein / location=Cvel_scaffold461:68502-70913(+) / protein_length=185 / sequence_SO=supercontig / SO=protein_coding / is_pseudo=false